MRSFVSLYRDNPAKLWQLAGIGDGKTGQFGGSAKISAEMFDRGEDDYLRYVLRDLLNQTWERSILPNLDKPIFIRTRMEALPSASMPWVLELRAIADIQEVQERPVIWKIAHDVSALPPDVYKCDWCGGYTHNDKRGHCCACGGPRSYNKDW